MATDKQKTIKLGGLSVPLPGFGAMGMSAFCKCAPLSIVSRDKALKVYIVRVSLPSSGNVVYTDLIALPNSGSNDQENNEKVLKHAIDIGCTFWDSANIYGMGHNEELIGKILKDEKVRSKIFVATKFGGFQFDKEAKKITGGPNGKPEYLNEMFKDSVEKLGFTPDLYYQHRVDSNTPIEETVKAMDELRQQGKIKYIGLSEASAATLRKAAAVTKIDFLQTEFSPWVIDIEENGILETCKELGITIVAYSPLGRGFLTGRFKSIDDFEEGDFRKNNPRFMGKAFDENLKIVRELEGIAEKKGCTAGQLTLAWVIAQGFIPIPGTRSIKYLDENWAAGRIDITPEEMKAIRKVVDKAAHSVVGERYADMKSVNK